MQGISAPDAETAMAERRAKMGSVLSEVSNALEGDLRNISGDFPSNFGAVRNLFCFVGTVVCSVKSKLHTCSSEFACHTSCRTLVIIIIIIMILVDTGQA